MCEFNTLKNHEGQNKSKIEIVLETRDLAVYLLTWILCITQFCDKIIWQYIWINHIIITRVDSLNVNKAHASSCSFNLEQHFHMH